jgi:hypothetical protein
MLYLVPLRGAWRQVTDRDGQLELVRQLLKLNFPQTDTISVAATTVSRNHEALGARVTLFSHRPPPAADRIDGKGGGVVIGADADPSSVVGDVVDAVRHGALQFGIDEVVNIDQFRRALTAPFPAVVPGREFMMPGVCRLMGRSSSPTLFTLWLVNRCASSATLSMGARVT